MKIAQSKRPFRHNPFFGLGAALLCGTAMLCGRLEAAPFVHPGLLSTRAELDFLRARIKEGKDPWKSALASMKSDGSASSNFTPKVKDVLNLSAGGSEDALAWFSSCHAAYAHALLFALTGNEANAAKSAQIIHAWASKMTQFKGTDGALDRSWSIPMVLAAELLKHEWGKWKPAEMAQFEKFLRERINPGLPTSGNNWGATGNTCRIAIGVFLDDKAIFDQGVASYKEWMKGYIKEDGWCSEHGRDLCHSRMGMGAAYMAGEIGHHQGVNLWDPYGDQRLMKSSERGVVLLDGHPRKQGKYGCSHTPNWPIWELAYNHFRLRLGQPMPETEAFKGKFRPDISRFGTPWLSVTHAELGNAGSKPTRLALLPAPATAPFAPGTILEVVDLLGRKRIPLSFGVAGLPVYPISSCECKPEVAAP